MKIYLDTNFFIEFIESDNEILRVFYQAAGLQYDVELITSELTLLETLTGAIRDADQNEIAAYETWLNETNEILRVVPISREVLRKAADVRVTTGNKTPDAIHVATAVLSECDALVSSDRGLRVPAGMRKVSLDQLGNLL
jgi:predicted nucleic acid-binding protein